MLKETPIDTRYLTGTEYHYSGNELDHLDPHQRDQKAISILIQNNKPVLYQTYAKKAFNSLYQHSGWIIVTHNYKQKAIDKLVEDIEGE